MVGEKSGKNGTETLSGTWKIRAELFCAHSLYIYMYALYI